MGCAGCQADSFASLETAFMELCLNTELEAIIAIAMPWPL
jgi:hypothetical protein